MKKKPFSQKFIYHNIPRNEQKTYLLVIKYLDGLNSNNYYIVTTRNVYQYISNHKKEKLFIIRYYNLENKNFDFSLIKNYEYSKNYYQFEDINILYSLIQSTYNLVPLFLQLNLKYNKQNLSCKKCHYLPQTNEELIEHLKECWTYSYTLYNESIPKHLKPSKPVKSVTNNVTINNYNYNVSFRQTGDYIRAHLSESEKLRILNSIDKVGEMVKRHFEYPEIAGNIRIKNCSPYSTCEVYNGDRFELKNNKDIFRYYITDHLDSLDFMAYDLKDDRITRQLEKYDDNIRKNDNNMNKCIQKTIKEVKYFSEKNI